MAREWSLGRFVRLYVGESPDEAAWDWQARCVWPLLLKVADRAGVIETTKGAKGVAAQIRMPVEVVDPALTELLEDGCLVQTARGYLVRNYIEAQTARMAASQRQAEYKARERAREAMSGDAECNDADAEVTRGDTESREVTASNAESRGGDSDLSRAELSRAEERECGPAAPAALTLSADPVPEKPDPAKVAAVAVVALLNTRTGRKFDAGSAETLKDCRANLKAGRSVDDLLAVVGFKCDEWIGDDRMAKHLKPAVLLRPSNVGKYLDEIKAGPPKVRAKPTDRFGRPAPSEPSGPAYVKVTPAQPIPASERATPEDAARARAALGIFASLGDALGKSPGERP